MDEPNILTDCALFRGLRRAQIREMLPCLSARQARFRRGQFLLRAGDRASSAGIILSGEAEVLRRISGATAICLPPLGRASCLPKRLPARTPFPR